MKNSANPKFEITATDPASMERQLDEAVAAAKTRAMREGSGGILVTRHSFDTFTVALSDDVPFGTTRECVQWRESNDADSSNIVTTDEPSDS